MESLSSGEAPESDVMSEKLSLLSAMKTEDRIRSLKTQGLDIKNEDAAAEFLDNVSWYRLKGYCDGLKKVDRKFMAGVTFDTLVKLYEFDSEMRKIIFAGIEKIEIGFRTRLVKFYSLKYGSAGYLVCDNMDMTVPRNRTGFSNDGSGDAEKEPGVYACEIIDGIKSDIEHNKHNPDIRMYKREYDGEMPPFDVTAEFLSFGQMGKFYICMKSDDKMNFCREYYAGIETNCFDVWLDNIIYVRNMCARHMRIYGTELRHRSTIRSDGMLITEDGMPGNGIFGVLACMKRLLGDKEWAESQWLLMIYSKSIRRLMRLQWDFPWTGKI